MDNLTLDDIFDPQPLDDEPAGPTTDSDTPDEPDASDEPTASDEDTERRQAYFDFLVSQQVVEIPEEFEYDGSLEKLEEALSLSRKKQQEKVYQDLFAALDPQAQEALNFALQTGQPLHAYYESLATPSLNYNPASPTDQKKIVEQYLKETTRYSPEKITKTIALYEEEGILEQESQDALAELTQFYSQKQEEQATQLQAQRQAEERMLREKTEALAAAINTSSFIHPTRREKVRSFFFNPIQVEQNQTTAFNLTINHILSNPEHQAQLADLLLDYNPEQGFTLDRFEKRLKSKATSSFKEDLDKALDPKRKATAAKVQATDSTAFLQE
jgi:hypothetical protein